MAPGRGVARVPPVTKDARRETARQAVADWISQPAFEQLVELFAGTSDRTVLSAVADSVQRHSDWALGGETASNLLAAASAGDRLAQQLLGIEEFASFCWDFRSGMPRAVLHLVAKASGRGAVDEHLPALARPGRWTFDLLTVYCGNRSSEVQAALKPASTTYPDARPAGYRERWEAADLPFPGDVRQFVHAAADELGLVTPGRPRGEYDHVIVLGGGGTSPWIRVHYAAELIDAFGLASREIWMLGSPRPVDQGAERELIGRFVERDPNVSSRYLTDTADEFDLMAVAAESAFGARDHQDENVCGCADLTVGCPQWQSAHAAHPGKIDKTPPQFQHQRHRTYRSGGGRQVHVIAPSTGRPPDRPNTADTYALLAELAHLGEGQRALIVTTQVFVPFQRFDAIRMLQLPTGLGLDVVGFGAERGDRPSTPEFELQEILSGLRSARRLLDAVV